MVMVTTRRHPMWALGAMSIFAIGASGACESTPPDDSEPSEVAAPDGGDASAEGADAGDAASAETIPTCGETVCPIGPDPVCDVDRAVRIGSEATCEDTANGPACGLEEVQTRCDEDPNGLCLGGECVVVDGGMCGWKWGEHLAITSEFRFGNHSDEINPETGKPVDECCFDFDGDGDIDNSWSESLKSLAPFLGDANEVIATQLENDLAWNGFDVLGLDDIENDPQVELVGYFLVPSRDNDGAHPSSGQVKALMRASSFRDGTLLPRISASGSIVNGRFVSQVARYVILLGNMDLRIELPFRGVRIEADVKLDENGKGVIFDGDGLGAKIGGYVLRSDLFEALNRDLSDTCVCKSTGPDGVPLDPANGTCYPPADFGCEDPDPVCAFLHGPLCESFVSFYQPDFDSDGDGVLDAQTSGIFFRTRQVEITGWHVVCQ
jgi:hypothetical protein